MIERVAQALAQTNHARAWERMTDTGKSWWRTEARAAIEAMRVPTKAMEYAGNEESGHGRDIQVWQAMIDAALAMPSEERL